MSILSSLYHGEIRDRPNDVHNVPPRPDRGEADHCRDKACEAAENRADRAHTPAPDSAKNAAESAADRPSAGADSVHPLDGHTDGNAVLPAHARRRMRALRDSRLRPPLYYTQQEQNPCASGVWESPHTVASKLESKEEYPQG